MTLTTTCDQSASPSTNGTGLNDLLVFGECLERATTIVLADDHRLVRSALRTVLEDEGGMEVVAEAGDLGETVRKVQAYKPDVLVLDLNMPGGSGIQAIPELRKVSPCTAIVVLTMEGDPEFARAALRSGARAFVPKEAADTELISAVQAAANGHGYLDPQLGARIGAEPPPASWPPDGLTERQLEVLHLLVNGYTNSEIGNELGIAERTVESHRAHIQHKVHRKSRADLVAYAAEHGLLDY